MLQALFAKHGYGDKFAEFLNIPDNEGKAGMKRLVYLGDEFKNVPFSALQAASLYDLMRDAFIPGLSPEGLYKRAELEFAVLKERSNFKPEQFIDDRFYKAALKALGNEPGAKS